MALVCAGLFAAPADAALPRSPVDRLDEVRGPQLHFVYVLPADGADRQLDETGALEGSVASFQAWLAAETGGANLRVDTYQGSLDVSFFRLAATDAAVASRGAFVREAVEQELRAAGIQPAEPDLRRLLRRLEHLLVRRRLLAAAAERERGRDVPPRPASGVARPATRPASPQRRRPPTYWEYAMLHDILHGLGIVADVRAAQPPGRPRLRLRQRPDVGGEPALVVPGAARHRPRRLLRPRPDRLRRPRAQPLPHVEPAAAARARRDLVQRRQPRAARQDDRRDSSSSASTGSPSPRAERPAPAVSARARCAPSPSPSPRARRAAAGASRPARRASGSRATVRATVGGLGVSRSLARTIR